MNVPNWWGEWLEAAEARLRPGTNPFGISSKGGTLSQFALNRLSLPRVDSLHVAKGFISSLAKIQTSHQVSIAFVPHTNFSDLESGNVYLDGSVITECRFRPRATFSERLDILSGIGLHEAMHLECSIPELCLKAKERGQLFSQIHNIVEDEFIESRLAQISPGYVGYLQTAKAYMFGDVHKALVGEDCSLLNVFLLFVRYPKDLNWLSAAPYARELGQVKDILTPFPTSGLEVFQTVERIHELLEKSQNLRSLPESTAGLQDFLARTIHHQYPLIDPVKELRKRGLRLLDTPDPPTSERDLESKVTWETLDNNLIQYKTDKATVGPYVQKLRAWLRAWNISTSTPVRERPRGRLDPSKLHTIPMGNERIFQQRLQPSQRRVAIALLIDESGSMQGPKIDAARQVAVLFREALHSVRNIELFIFGHTADNPRSYTNLYRYWQPGWKKRYSLGNIISRQNNRDGIAIQTAAQEVKRITRFREIILMVISDGQPNAHRYKGDPAVAHTREIVKKLQREMTVIQIAIEPVVESARMFDHYVRFTDLAALPNQMARLLRKLLR